MTWTQPICSRCWYERNPDRAPIRVMEGDDFESLLESCAWCGEETIDGIYVLVDPRTVAFPKEDDGAS